VGDRQRPQGHLELTGRRATLTVLMPMSTVDSSGEQATNNIPMPAGELVVSLIWGFWS
jgi:hypothetical protein